jgi:membrane-bound ClpP family serine protease
MRKDKFDRIIGFLLGASWAIVIFGSLITFKAFSSLGVVLSLFITILYILISLFLVLTLDSFSVKRRTLEESKKQTKLLEKIYAKHAK